MTHPLTDKIIDKFGTDDQQFAFELATKWEPTRIYLDDDMRAAADWQLEQVIEWMKVNLMKHDFHEGYAYLYDDCSNAYIREEELLKDLREAMRPQEDS
jgi:hypothetical protein